MADYTPEKGQVTPGIFLTHGIIKSEYQGQKIRVDEAVARRLDPHSAGEATCNFHEMLLPRGASDLLLDPVPLFARYREQLLPDQVDLLGITTVRFSKGLAAHEQWELARGWVRSALVKEGLAVLLVQHLPRLAGRSHKDHCHAIWPVRLLQRCDFGRFTPLAKPGSKGLLATTWEVWLRQENYEPE